MRNRVRCHGYAAIVLPAATGYEITSFTTYGPMFRIREKLLDPVGEARGDYVILTELARRLGYGDRYPQTEEDALRYVLEGSGFTLEDVRAAGGYVSIEPVIMQYKKWEKGLLRPDGAPGFDTPTGKFEILSTTLEEHGYEGRPSTPSPVKVRWPTRSSLSAFPWCSTRGHGSRPISARSSTASRA